MIVISSFCTLLFLPISVENIKKSKATGAILYHIRLEEAAMYQFNVLSDALDYIENNLCEDIIVEAVSEACFCSETGLQTMFSYVFDCSVKDYVIKRRMTRAARELISCPDLNILDIAGRYGYSSNEAFTRAFKQMWKCTPSAFRNQKVDMSSSALRNQKLDTPSSALLSQKRFTEIMPRLSIPSEEEDSYTKSRRHMDITRLYDLYVERRNCFFICCGIRGLALINKLSRKVGDAAILEAIRRIENACSEEDVVFRIGGDEIVILTNSKDIREAEEIAERIRTWNGASIPSEELEVPLFIYTGITRPEEVRLDKTRLYSSLQHTIKYSKVGKTRVIDSENGVRVLGEYLGSGASSEVYEYENNRVIKLYKAECSATLLRNEFDKMKAAYQCHIPVPRVDEIVEYHGRFGYIMERVPGDTLQRVINREVMQVRDGLLSEREFEEKYFHYIKLTAKCLYEIHRNKCNWNMSMRELIHGIIPDAMLLSDADKRKVMDIVDQLPDGTSLCHGDPNANNIMLDGENMRLIDWPNAAVGNPMCDIAEYVWLSNTDNRCYKDIPAELEKFFYKNREEFISVFISEYESLSGMDVSGYEVFLVPLLVVKLNSNRTLEEKRKILNEIRMRMNR